MSTSVSGSGSLAANFATLYRRHNFAFIKVAKDGFCSASEHGVLASRNEAGCSCFGKASGKHDYFVIIAGSILLPGLRRLRHTCHIGSRLLPMILALPQGWRGLSLPLLYR